MHDKDQDNPSDGPGATDQSARAPTCVACGDPIDTAEWYPIRGHAADDGTLELYEFCSEACQEAWSFEQDAP